MTNADADAKYMYVTWRKQNSTKCCLSFTQTADLLYHFFLDYWIKKRDILVQIGIQ